MQILLVADLHYTLPQFDWVVAQAPQFDLVVLAGDHLDVSSTVPLDAQAAVVVRYVELLAGITRVAVSSGNHDLTGPDRNGEQAAVWLDDVRAAGVPTDGDTVELGDVLVTICPWWDGPLGRDAVDAMLARDAERRERTGAATWVWVYHWPPVDSPTSWTGTRHYGDPDVLGWIHRHGPDVVLTGHVHQSPFKDGGSWVDRIGTTSVFNAGRQTGPIPAHVELDLGQRWAGWSSLMGRADHPH